ncbi:hypothetical protein pb186bvf_007580 [Paramecium bursaria]
MGNCTTPPIQQEQNIMELDFNRPSTYQKFDKLINDYSLEHDIGPQYHSLLQRMIGSKQEYILQRMDEMDRYSKAMFLQNLERIDFEMIDSLLHNCYQKEQNYFPANIKFISGKDQSKGLSMIKNREVGLFLMAGGRSTRYPDKPICKPGSPSRKAPIQLIFERLRKIIQLSQEEDTFNYKGLPIGIMLSDAIGIKIKDFIREKKQFGFESIDYLYQKTLPVLDSDKKIVFNVKDEPVLTPNGTGYVFPLLIQFMRKHPNLKYIHVLGCENLLALPLDPYLLEQDADIICKAVDSHLYCDDKIYYQDGLFKYLDEIVDLSMTENTEKITKMCLNDLMISVDFLERLSLDKQKQFKLAQKYHVIKRGNQMHFERHVFDVFEVTDNLLLLKSNENALILDDAKKAVIQLSNHHKQWVGLTNLNEEDLCEVCPNMSYNGEGLKQFQVSVFLNALKYASDELDTLIALDYKSNNERINERMVRQYFISYKGDTTNLQKYLREQYILDQTIIKYGINWEQRLHINFKVRQNKLHTKRQYEDAARLYLSGLTNNSQVKPI